MRMRVADTRVPVPQVPAHPPTLRMGRRPARRELLMASDMLRGGRRRPTYRAGFFPKQAERFNYTEIYGSLEIEISGHVDINGMHDIVINCRSIPSTHTAMPMSG